LNRDDAIVSSPDHDFDGFAENLDRYAARLNPGLCAVALVLSGLVLAEATARLSAYVEQSVAPQSVPLTSDPTALMPVDIPPFE
jgi:hypothetical protein